MWTTIKSNLCKKIALINLLLLLLITIFPDKILAHPGNTDSFGCHTCHTNCTDWGLYYGEYHCHTPKYTTPTCPLFSSYNSLSGSCECYSGYISSGTGCISMDQNCKNQLGYSSRYNSLSNRCECSYGYVIDNYGKCSSGNSICWNKYGYNSEFNNLDNTCECRYGYVFNQSGTKCISEDEACKEQFGYGSKSTIIGDKCECRDSYIWEGNKCVLETTYKEPEYIPIRVNTPSPTTISTIKTKVSTPNPITSEPVLTTPNETNNTSVKGGILIQIWNFIKGVIGL